MTSIWNSHSVRSSRFSAHRGSGKSTLLRLIAGLDERSAGHIDIDCTA
ncbi:ATP-binding cassette domain-containing protein [Mycolicibacterium septicum]|nr:ATP-binding cassette domain-containing protein [Mycolicibacterium septicum]MDF3335827.1 ATP-binding cassette domain-containing protein [Mycolicibacterium septicum]